MAISPLAAQAHASESDTRRPTDGAGPAATADFDAFLTLLTAQVRHQDPLAPIDSTQFVEQLATFSSLEQQVTTNEHLESIAALIAEGLTR